MGGNIPLGYDLVGRKLVVNEVEAEQVRTIFRLYAKYGSVLEVQRELDRLKIRTKLHTSQTGKTRGGRPFHGSHLYWILHSHLYRGEVNHRGAIYPGEHESIVDQALWDAVQASFASNAAVRRSGKTIKQPSLLAGLLFDGKGGRMGSHHACKPGKEYRYYLSDSLTAKAKRKRANDIGEGLRLPAQEIESHVIATVAAFLCDTQQLVAECCPRGTLPSVSSAALRQAATLAALLKTGGGHEHYELIRAVVKRVQVFEKSICITLDRQPLAARLQISVNSAMQEPETPLELSVPAELRRIGKEKRLIMAALVPKTNPDAILIKAIVRAHLWFGMLRDRKVESISELAKVEQLPRTYVGSVIPFAFLAPDITDAILNGTQPIELNLDRLINATLPLNWAEQRVILGFN